MGVVAASSSPALIRNSPVATTSLGADPLHDQHRHRREAGRDERERQRRQPGVQRREPAHDLEVLGDHEDEPEQAEERQRDRAARRGEPGVAEQPHVEHRVRPPRLPPGEDRQHRQRAADPADGRGRSPAMRRRLDDRPGQQRDPDDREQRAERVEPACLAGPWTRAAAAVRRSARRPRPAPTRRTPTTRRSAPAAPRRRPGRSRPRARRPPTRSRSRSPAPAGW